jgi:hypothetical protein
MRLSESWAKDWVIEPFLFVNTGRFWSSDLVTPKTSMAIKRCPRHEGLARAATARSPRVMAFGPRSLHSKPSSATKES